MKPLVFGLMLATAISCGGSSDSNPDPAGPTTATGFLLSKESRFAVKIVWNTPPVSQSFDNSAEVYFRNADDQVPTSSELKRFHLYMASMGHPSIKEDAMVFTPITADHWSVSRIYFSMGGSAGSWVVDLDASVNDQADSIRVSINHEVE